MFGLRSTDGSALFMGGQGIIDNTGINTNGINYGLRQYAEDPTDSTTKRYFRLEMLLPDGRTQPAGSLTFTTGDETNLITNGDAETGDLSNWTQSGTLWSADSTEYHGGAYSFKFDNNTGSAETLTSDRYAASASKVYSISAWMKEYYNIVGVQNMEPSGLTFLSSANPTTNYSTESKKYSGWDYGGYEKEHMLVKYDLSSIPTNIQSASDGYLNSLVGNGSAQTQSVYKCLRNWVEGEATWNIFSTGNNWGTAGAENTTSDRGATVLGSSTSTGSISFNLNDSGETAIFDMITGNNYGFVIRGTTESGTTDKYAYCSEVGVPFERLNLDFRYTEASKYTVYMKWYDDASAGNLIRTDTLFIENNTNSWNERTATVTTPAGALSYEIIISGDKGREFWVDDIVVAEQAFANKLLFLPELSYQDSDSTRRILSAKKELYAPLAPVISLDTVVYQPDDTTGVDAFMNSGAATTNNGTHVEIYAGENNTNTSVYRGLIKFAPTNLPTGTQIDSATLALTVSTDLSSNARTLNAYRMLIAWVEGEVTWNKRNATTDWATAGCNLTTEVEAASSGSVAFTATEAVGTTKSISLDATKTQAMLDGSFTNNGWMLRMDTETNDAYGMDSSSSATAGERPKFTLVIDDAWKCTDGAHKVKITFVDADGETSAGAESNSVTVSATSPFIIVPLEIGPEGTTARNIYMTEAGGSTFKFAHTVNDNSTTTYTLNIPDSDLTTVAPTINSSGKRILWPETNYISGLSVISNTTLALQNDSVMPYYLASAANANNGDWYKYPPFYLRGGTYKFIFNGKTNTDMGRVDWYLDNTLIISAQEWYAASGTYNASESTGIVVSGDGTHIMKAVVNGKHASSTDYRFGFFYFTCVRTGA